MDEKLIYEIAAAMIAGTMLEIKEPKMQEFMIDSVYSLTTELLKAKYKKPELEVFSNLKKAFLKVNEELKKDPNESSTFRDFINNKLKS